MILSGDRVLVAVSGGIDSVVLLDVLYRLSPKWPFHLLVGHIDHGLRAAASVEDAAFVRALAGHYGLACVQCSLSDADLDRHRSQGREGAARRARLNELQRLAKEAGAERIALGHTLDDQAETILYRIARGAGTRGLRGMAPVRGPFIRPLIHASRADIVAYAEEQGLTWRNDASNVDLSFARNRIRHRILPEFRAIHPRVAEVLCRDADLLGEYDEAMTFLVNQQLERLRIEADGSSLTLDRNALAAFPAPVFGLVLREALRRSRGVLDGMERVHIDAVRRLVTGTRAHGELSLPDIQVRMQRDALTFNSVPAPPVHPWELRVEVGETMLPDSDSVLELQVVPRANVDMASIRSDPWIEAADADRVAFPLVLRTRRPGDRFAPLGLGREMKLKTFLINERIPYFDRDRVPLLCDIRGILWVVGVRLSDTVTLSGHTQRVLLMRMKGVR